MQQIVSLIILNFLLLVFPIQAKSLPEFPPLNWQNLPLKASIIERIKKDYIYASSQVTTSDQKNSQKLILRASALHPRSCQVALPILSQYENYHNYIDFIETSLYDKSRQKIYLLLSSPLLPFKMEMQLTFPRMTGPGSYPFTFDLGFLKGLEGLFQSADLGGRCLFYLEANWTGAKTSFPDLLFETFSQTLTEIGFKRLIKISTP